MQNRVILSKIHLAFLGSICNLDDGKSCMIWLRRLAYFFCCLNEPSGLVKNCVKSAHIRSFSGPYFPASALNTERYQENTEYGDFFTQCIPAKIVENLGVINDSEKMVTYLSDQTKKKKEEKCCISPTKPKLTVIEFASFIVLSHHNFQETSLALCTTKPR